MPVIYIRSGNPSPPIDTMTQTVGTLEFQSATVIELSASVFTSSGVYVLFDYTTFTGGQAALNSFVTVTHPTLTPSNLTDDTANTRILVTLT